MQNPVLKDKYIACPFQIQMCDMQGGFSLGTAFFYECEGETVIITNWHNVTGKHPQTGAELDAMRSPSYIRAKWPVVDDSVPKVEGAKQFYFQAQKIEIEDESGPLCVAVQDKCPSKCSAEMSPVWSAMVSDGDTVDATGDRRVGGFSASMYLLTVSL